MGSCSAVPFNFSVWQPSINQSNQSVKIAFSRAPHNQSSGAPYIVTRVQVPILTLPIPTVPIPTMRCTLFGSAYFGQMRISHIFPHITANQAYRILFTHIPTYVHIFLAYFCIFSLIVGTYLGIFRIFFAHISCLYTAHICEIPVVMRFSGFPRYITRSVTGFPALASNSGIRTQNCQNRECRNTNCPPSN